MTLITILASLLLSPASHAVPSGEPINRGCFLPADQGRGSLHGQWEQLPISLVFDSEFYSKNGGRDARALERAVGTWNNWAKAKGKVAFVITKRGTGQEIPELTDCSQASYTAVVPDAVGVWKINGEGFRRNRRASCGTNSDGTPGKLLPFGTQNQTDWRIEGGKIAGASILLNFEDYNAPGKHYLDVESRMLHELGHVLGLLHSCNGSNDGGADSTTAPSCYENGKPSAPGEYLEAVMFPFLEPLELRRSLKQNDFDRVNCLY